MTLTKRQMLGGAVLVVAIVVVVVVVVQTINNIELPPGSEKGTKIVYNRTRGVCRSNGGRYPRWTGYRNVTNDDCKRMCNDNINCQGYAFDESRKYCQLFGRDGSNPGTHTMSRITRGDMSQPSYVCNVKGFTDISIPDV